MKMSCQTVTQKMARDDYDSGGGGGGDVPIDENTSACKLGLLSDSVTNGDKTKVMVTDLQLFLSIRQAGSKFVL